MAGLPAAAGGATRYGAAVALVWLAAALAGGLAVALRTPATVLLSMALGAAALLALLPWSIGTRELTR